MPGALSWFLSLSIHLFAPRGFLDHFTAPLSHTWTPRDLPA